MTQVDRVPLPGSDKKPVPSAQPVADVHPDERIEVTVRVRQRAQGALVAQVNQLAAQSPEAREHLSREDFAQQFGADPADLAKVEQFAAANGLAVVEANLARRTVLVSGPATKVSAAFGVTLRTYDHPVGGAFRGREGAIYVPANLAGIVEGVFGLDDRPAARPHLRRLEELDGIQPLLAAPRTSFTPNKIGQLYDFPTGVTGQGQCVAIIELGGGYRAADLRAYFQQLGIPQPTVVSVSVDHGKNQPAGPNSADGEVMLDIEVVGAIAPGARIVVYFAPNTDQGFVDAISTAVHDTVNRPSVVSISWGAPEVNWTQASVTAMDQAFQAATVMGVTVYCASGDNGANDFPPGPGSQPGNHADFPASSPHVVGCGGTKITAPAAAITDEVVWNDPGDGASGGGFSTLFPTPAWQANAVSGGKRGVPDVAGDASPLSGYVVRVDGQNSVIGGTSAVAPLWAGLTALLNQKMGKPLGFANPLLYGMAASSGALWDVTQGNNNGFNAGPGWDPCTGLGRPDGAKLLAALTGAHAAAPAR
ncbi:MAG TPA: S53 family peptidase [Chloroflexota bacterium]|nr:S53 family peptidase [Chloroflexota bacterium]